MIRITVNKGLMTHDCVQCGCLVQYYDHEPAICPTCHAHQRLFNVTRSTEIQFEFILGEDIWRTWYHLSRTNCT